MVTTAWSNTPVQILQMRFWSTLLMNRLIEKPILITQHLGTKPISKKIRFINLSKIYEIPLVKLCSSVAPRGFKKPPRFLYLKNERSY